MRYTCLYLLSSVLPCRSVSLHQPNSRLPTICRRRRPCHSCTANSRTRVFLRPQYSVSHGMTRAVMSSFEARLYLSYEPKHDARGRRVFVVEENLAKRIEDPLPPYRGGIGVWRLKLSTKFLLRVAYRSEIKRYVGKYEETKSDSEKLEREDPQIGQLFKECLDC